MALMLRKACQPILNDYDLDAYHADLNPDDKSLQIFTPCGKKFAMVSGVRFGTLNPTKAEIEFTTELLGDWLLRNKEDIDSFIEAFETLQRTPWPEDTDAFEIGSCRVYKDGKYVREPQGLNVRHNNVIYGIDTEHKMVASMTLLEPVRADTGVKLPLKVLEAGIVHYNQVMAHREAQRVVDTKLAELNSCES